MKTKLKNKKIILKIALPLLAAFILVWAGCFGKNKDAKYTTELPQTENITEKVEASGTINPVTQTSVGTQVSGKIQQLLVDYNTIVKKGQLLAVVDPSSYESALVQQQANLQKAQSVFLNSKRNYERYQRLYAQELVSKSDLEDAETDYLTNQAQVTQAQASLDNAKINLGYTKIYSPVNGIVISRAVEEGQTVAASFSTPTLFTVAEDLTKMQIEVNISEADISKIKEGQEVEFNVDAYPDTTFKGNVKQVRNSATTISNVVTYTVVVGVDNKDLKLKPGMTANVSIITGRSDGAFTVANSALRFVPPDNAEIAGQKKNGKKTFYKGQGVWTLEKGNRIKRVQVETGITDGNRTVVTGNDITAQTPVIISSEGANTKKKSNNRMGPPGF